jgi:hypothetical protein
MAVQPAAIIEERRVGQFRVQVFLFPGNGEPCYRILIEVFDGVWRKVSCWSRSDERRFPKRAAAVGHEMVEAYKRASGEAQGSAKQIDLYA